MPPDTRPTVAMLVVFGTMVDGNGCLLPAIVTGLTDRQEISLFQAPVGDDETPAAAITRCANRHLAPILRHIPHLPNAWQERDMSLMGWVYTTRHRLMVFNLRWLLPPEVRQLGQGKLRCLALDHLDLAPGPFERLTRLALEGLPPPNLRAPGTLMEHPPVP